jgi:hypothetical protein
MPSYVLKVERVEDLYVYWSTVVDSPTIWGDRAYLQHELSTYEDRDAGADVRFERADRYGTSALWPYMESPDAWGGWNDAGFVVMNNPKGCGFLNRGDLKAFLESFDGESFDPKFLQPFEDDLPVPTTGETT